MLPSTSKESDEETDGEDGNTVRPSAPPEPADNQRYEFRRRTRFQGPARPTNEPAARDRAASAGRTPNAITFRRKIPNQSRLRADTTQDTNTDRVVPAVRINSKAQTPSPDAYIEPYGIDLSPALPQSSQAEDRTDEQTLLLQETRRNISKTQQGKLAKGLDYIANHFLPHRYETPSKSKSRPQQEVSTENVWAGPSAPVESEELDAHEQPSDTEIEGNRKKKKKKQKSRKLQ